MNQQHVIKKVHICFSLNVIVICNSNSRQNQEHLTEQPHQQWDKNNLVASAPDHNVQLQPLKGYFRA